ncbi:tetratricopeptide TPR_2, partial [mine drainage metagenome]
MEYLYSKSNALLLLKRADESLVVLESAIAMDPSNQKLRNSLSNVKKEAITRYGSLIKLDPKQPEYFYNRGKLLFEIKRYKECLQDAEQAVALSGDNPEYRYLRGRSYLATGVYDIALDDLTFAVSEKPDEPAYVSGRAVALARTGSVKDALAEADSLKAGDSPDIAFDLGIVYGIAGRTEDAIHNFDAAIALLPAESSYHLEKGNVLFSSENYDPALSEYDIALSLDPGDGVATYSKAECLFRMGKAGMSTPFYKKASELNPQNHVFRFTYGLHLFNDKMVGE